MFGREAWLTVDICFGVAADNTSPLSHLKYVTQMKQESQAAYQLSQATADKMNQINKKRYALVTATVGAVHLPFKVDLGTLGTPSKSLSMASLTLPYP